MIGTARVMAMAAVSLLALAGCENARTAGVVNDSDCTMRVRFWVGDREQGSAAADLRPGEVHDVLPGRTFRYQFYDESGFVSGRNSFVRVQLQPLRSSFERPVQYWFELNPPGPYVVRVFGVPSDLRFDRRTGVMTAVPRELWPSASADAP